MRAFPSLSLFWTQKTENGTFEKYPVFAAFTDEKKPVIATQHSSIPV